MPKHLSEGTHLFFDLDNTILTTIHDFGSGSWEVFMIDHFMKEGDSAEKAIDRANSLWKAVQMVSTVRLVEEETARVVRQMQKEYPVLAITARSPELAQLTENQLNSLGIQFPQGIFYCGNDSKGEVLKSYVERSNCPRIVLVDDTNEHLKSAAEHLSIPFKGLRYKCMDYHKNSYVPDEVSLLLCKVFINPEACKYLIEGLAK